MTSPHPPSWQNPRIVLTLLVVFICGASAGMLVMALGAHRLMHSQAHAAWRDTGKDVSVQHLKQELNLTPAQTEQLETILDDFFTYYHTLQAQLDDVRTSGRQRIMRILNEDQKKRFEKMIPEPHDQTQLH